MDNCKLEKTIEGIEAIREFFGFGLPSQNKAFKAYQTILTDTLELLKEQADEIEKLKRTHIVSSGDGMAIHRTVNQTAKEIHNIGHVEIFNA